MILKCFACGTVFFLAVVEEGGFDDDADTFCPFCGQQEVHKGELKEKEKT